MKSLRESLLSGLAWCAWLFGLLSYGYAQELIELEPIPLEEEEADVEAVLESVNLADYILTQEELRERDGSAGSVTVSSAAEDSGDGVASSGASSGQKMRPPHIILLVGKNHSALAASPYLETTESWLKPAEKFASMSPFLTQMAASGVQFDSAWSTGWESVGVYQALLSGFHPVSGRAGNLSLAAQLRSLGYQTAAFGFWAERVLPSERGFSQWEITQAENRLLNPVYIGSEGRKIERGHETKLTTDKLIDWLAEQDFESSSQPVFVLCQFGSPGEWPLSMPEQSGFWGPELVLDEAGNWQWHPAIPWRVPVLEQEQGEVRAGGIIPASQVVKLGPEFARQNRAYYRANSNQRWPGDLDRAAEAGEEERLLGHLLRGNSLRRQAQASGFALVGEELQRWQQQRYLREYLGGVRSVDFAISRIAQSLQAEGILENTLLIYAGAQGIELGEAGWIGGSKAGREAGLRVPMIWHWPRALPAGKVVEAPVALLDVAPTLLRIAEEQSGKGLKQGGQQVRAESLYEPGQGAGTSLLPLMFATEENNQALKFFKQRPLYFADLMQSRWVGALLEGKFQSRQMGAGTEQQEASEAQDQAFWDQLRATWQGKVLPN